LRSASEIFREPVAVMTASYWLLPLFLELMADRSFHFSQGFLHIFGGEIHRDRVAVKVARWTPIEAAGDDYFCFRTSIHADAPTPHQPLPRHRIHQPIARRSEYALLTVVGIEQKAVSERARTDG